MTELTFHLYIVTGLSGAGKSTVMRCLEDMGTFCIDNLPPGLLPNLIESHRSGKARPRNLAVAIDIRGKDYFEQLTGALTWIEECAVPHTILFLDCHDDKLVGRFSETRRRHPLSDPGSLYDSIRSERESLAEIRDKSDLIIDTTHMLPAELKQRIQDMFRGTPARSSFPIHVMSFGYKFGIPLDSDIVFDVRFLPNPYWEPGLRAQTGLDDAVFDYVMKFKEARSFADELFHLIAPRIDAYVKEGKSRLTIAIGCTGGQHRSVAFAESLGRLFADSGFLCHVRHRESSHWPERQPAEGRVG